MIIGLGRMLLLMLALLTVVYISLFFYWRAGAKMRLEEQWVMAGRPGDREAWIDERIAPIARHIRTWTNRPPSASQRCRHLTSKIF